MHLPWLTVGLTLTWGLFGFTSNFQLQAKPIARTLIPVTQSLFRLSLNFEPPTDGRIPRQGRRDAGSRPGCPPVDKPLTALVPEYDLGLTVEEHPTFWVYVPYSSQISHSAKFVLWDDKQDKVYETTFQLKDTPGIISLSLPKDISLDISKIYKGAFFFKCGDIGLANVQWKVKRVTLSANLRNQLERATSRERIALYATNGLWHDALTELAQLRRRNPQDEILAVDWTELLRDADVHLDDMVEVSIVGCCIPER
jgi:hypothetical protein